MNEITLTPLGDLATLQAGVGFPLDLQGRESGDYPLAKVRDISRVARSGEMALSAADHYVDEEDLARLKARPIPAGSILFSKIGEAISQNYRVIAGCPLLIDNNAMAAIPNSRVENRYLCHFLRTVDFYALASSTTVPALRKSALERLLVPLPPIPEQRRISAILDKADELRAKRRAALAKLDSLTQSIFLDMFGDPATNPKGWSRKQIGQVATVITGNTPSRAVSEYYGDTEDTIEWIKSDNINTPHYFLTQADERLSAMGRQVARVAPAGSILVTCIAGSPACIGNSSMTDREVAFNQQINAVVPFEGNGHFIYGQLRVSKRLVQQASTAGMKGMVNKSRFERVALIWPPDPIQEIFAQRACTVEKTMLQQRASLDNLNGLFSSLQHRAFRGEL